MLHRLVLVSAFIFLIPFVIHCQRVSDLFLNVMQTSSVYAKSTSWCTASAPHACFSLARTKKNERRTRNKEKLHDNFIAKLIDKLRTSLRCFVEHPLVFIGFFEIHRGRGLQNFVAKFIAMLFLNFSRRRLSSSFFRSEACLVCRSRPLGDTD